MYNTFKTSKQHADMDAVKRVAEILMIINGETTTLEVKKLLRLEGFVAYQKHVSELMDAISCEHNWQYTSNGVYRTYTFVTNLNYQISPDIPKFSYS